MATQKKQIKKRAEDSYFKNLDKAGEVAVYYGFMPIETPEVSKSDIQKAKAAVEGDLKTKVTDCPLCVCPEDKVSILRLYTEKKMDHMPQPVMLYWNGRICSSGTRRKPTKEKHLSLEILGTPKSIAEAILIKTTIEILKEEGYNNLEININSIGDRDSTLRFTKELTNYYRKNINDLEPHCRQALKKDVFELLSCNDQKCEKVKNNAPKSISFLSEPSRNTLRKYLNILRCWNCLIQSKTV